MRSERTLALQVFCAAGLVLLCACAASAPQKDTKNSLLGGPCQYQDVSGTALITFVGPAPAGEYNCPNQAQKVLFSFYPADADAAESYLFPGWADEGNSLSVGGGANPPASWVLSQGLEIGVHIPAIRREIVSGTCTPVLFFFPGLDMESALEKCWQKN